MSDMMITNVKIKKAPPYSTDMERRVLMNSMARATLDPKTGSYSFPEKLETKVAVDSANVEAVAKMSHILAETGSAAGVGLDHGKSSCIVLLKFPELIETNRAYFFGTHVESHIC
jgi:fatty acid synthase subunit alpha